MSNVRAAVMERPVPRKHWLAVSIAFSIHRAQSTYVPVAVVGGKGASWYAAAVTLRFLNCRLPPGPRRWSARSRVHR